MKEGKEDRPSRVNCLDDHQLSARFVWGSEGVPFTFVLNKTRVKESGDTMDVIRKLDQWIGLMNVSLIC